MCFNQKGKEKVPPPRPWNITRKENKIKQYSVVEYLGCLVDENMSRKSMAKRALKSNGKQNFFIGRIGTYHTILKECYATLWPNDILILYVVLGIQTISHKKINCKQLRFCLGMERRSYIGLNHFQKINWLPVKNRVDQCIEVTTYNFKNNLSPDIWQIYIP